MKSISDDDLCSACMHCAYNPGEQSECSRSFPGTASDDGYITSCIEFQQIESQHDLVRAAAKAKQAYWNALVALERSHTKELSDEQNDAMCNAIDSLAASAPSTEQITDESAQAVLDAIASA